MMLKQRWRFRKLKKKPGKIYISGRSLAFNQDIRVFFFKLYLLTYEEYWIEFTCSICSWRKIKNQSEEKKKRTDDVSVEPKRYSDDFISL